MEQLAESSAQGLVHDASPVAEQVDLSPVGYTGHYCPRGRTRDLGWEALRRIRHDYARRRRGVRRRLVYRRLKFFVRKLICRINFAA